MKDFQKGCFIAVLIFKENNILPNIGKAFQ
jgi:hypothetical protein